MIKYYIIFTFLLFCLIYCTKEEIKNKVSNYVPLFSASIEGKEWIGTASWRTTPIPLVGHQTVITAVGSEGVSGSSIVITVGTNRAGAYSLGPATSGNTAYYIEGQKRYDATQGQIQFSLFDTINKRISGTFSIQVRNADGITKDITNGKFENLPQQL
ncbi:MAG: DUF6252 family protein [Bacteroidia bacterium]|nr:DUF6252 family protein [Bacteroidia bacterium]MDW8159686.1 DUF6252 family protein [Bacteroidia bacterium]